MKLSEVHSHEDLAIFYKENGLTDTWAKINALRHATRWVASRGDENDTPEEKLIGLEEIIIEHLWPWRDYEDEKGQISNIQS